MKKLTSHFQRPYLHLTSSGSFLDPDEIDEETLIEILRIIKKNNVEVLSTESRPEFVLNEQRLETMRENFNGSISIGIGLESSNDFIRNFCINKGFGTKAFMQAVDILKKHDITFHSYILLGKPFLSTYEDIEDTLRTIRLTISLGGIAIVRLVNLQAHTLVHWLWERNMYALPRLWSALRVLEDLTPTERSKVWIKGIDKDMPPAIAYAMNCEECTSTVHNALVGWNITRDYHIIKQIIDCCDCKIGWEKTLEEPSERNEKRILETYETIFDEMQQQSL